MLNYIKAELWKAFRNRGMYLLLFLLLLGTGLFAALMLAADTFAEMASAATTTMLLGVLVAPPLAQLVDGGTQGTLKNEVSFGVPRRRIYLGKLLAGLLLGVLLCLLLIGVYLLTGWLLLPHEPKADLVALAAVGFMVLAALPVWWGMYGLCHTMAMLIPSTAGWISLYYISTFFAQPILLSVLAGLSGERMSSLFQAVVMPMFLLLPDALVGPISWTYQAWCWSIGLGWLAATTGLGLLWIGRREIK